ATCQSLLCSLYLARDGKISPSGIILTNAVKYFHVAELNNSVAVNRLRNVCISAWQCSTTLISLAVTNRHRSMTLLTVGYIERKSVYTTGTATLRICALVRPPKNADCACPRYSLGKSGCRSRI